MSGARAAAGAGVLALSLAFACSPIIGSPLSDAPLNAGCPEVNSCTAYDVPNVTTKAQCNKGRCEFSRPAYAFSVVVDVPDSSFYASGRAFILSSNDLLATVSTSTSGCVLPTCLQLPDLNSTQGQYTVTSAAAIDVGYPLQTGTSLPIRVSYVPTSDVVPAGVPADPIVTSSRAINVGDVPQILYLDAVPVGNYQRIAYPEPPFDAFFPPIIGPLRVTATPTPHLDNVTLGDAVTPLDDEKGTSRTATVTRAEGLEGWRVWLADSTSQMRISSLRPLDGTTAVVRLDTVNRHQAGSTALDDNVDVIVAPPESWRGVPRLQSRLVNGQGLEKIDVPSLPAPATVTGQIASGQGTALTGIPAMVRLESAGLQLVDGTLQPLLRYATVVSTDNTGLFRTVLPPGFYNVTIEPLEGTGFAKVMDTFDTSLGLSKTYHPPPRTVATGRALLADGRPLAGANVYAIASEVPIVGSAVKPRPAVARTSDDGTFRFEVDQGQFDLTVEPQAGTGFPRVVQLRSFGTDVSDIGDIRIPPPAVLSFTIKDASQNLNPIVNAIVRVFAVPDGRGPPAVEIGRAMTAADGTCEILLAPRLP